MGAFLLFGYSSISVLLSIAITQKNACYYQE